MPFDSLILRMLQTRWQTSLAGAEIDQVKIQSGRVYFHGYNLQQNQPIKVLIDLNPGQARMHEVKIIPKSRIPLPSIFLRVVPFIIRSISVPPFERIIQFDIEQPEEWDRPTSRLIIELAGHLTNIIWINPDNIVIDALRKIPQGRPGRMVWPGQPYSPPPVLPNPCETQNAKHLPPAAKRYFEIDPTYFFQQFCNDWQTASWRIWALSQEDQISDVSVFPLPGYHPIPLESLEKTLDLLYRHRMQQKEQANLYGRLVRHAQDRINHLTKQRDSMTRYLEDSPPERLRDQADLWLAYQYLFTTSPEEQEHVVNHWTNPDQMVTLSLPADATPTTIAETLYQKYKKGKARVQSLEAMLPKIQNEIRDTSQHLQEIMAHEDDLSWLSQTWDKVNTTPRKPSSSAGQDPTHYRRFTSTSGHAIWIGRNQGENHRLTLQEARPDDVWFHVKQAPGSHVVLFCGKTNPALDDLLDAAMLAVIYSPAKQSSNVAVDYTRRKFVRKQPHGKPGQVLYQREKTLFVTPDTERLRRLGAIRDKLADV